MSRSILSRAFTLIELLVVIAIIAILAAILFPVFVQAKDASKTVTCLVHMRQVGVALMMYKNDNDDVWACSMNNTPLQGYPPQQPWIGYDMRNTGIYLNFYGRMDMPARNKTRPGAIDIYIKNDDLRKCPKTPPNYQMVIAYSWFNPAFGSAYYSANPKAAGNEYGPGSKTCKLTGGVWDCTAANDSELDEPAHTLVAWEHGARAPVCNFLQSDNWFNSPPNRSDLKAHFQWLHREGAITIWGDSHAKRTTYAQLKRPYFSVRKDIYQ